MHAAAVSGNAAHNAYKGGLEPQQARSLQAWTHALSDALHSLSGREPFLETAGLLWRVKDLGLQASLCSQSVLVHSGWPSAIAFCVEVSCTGARFLPLLKGLDAGVSIS